MAPENNEGETPDMKIRIQCFENEAKFHIFGEYTDKSKLNGRIYYDHRNSENFLQPFGIAYFPFPFVIYRSKYQNIQKHDFTCFVLE
jgi:hypothetical protein